MHLLANPCVLVKKSPMYGTGGSQQNVHHGSFLPTGQVLTAGGSGSIGVFEKNQCRMEIKAHDGAIKVMRLRDDEKTLVTAGADGHVKVWTVKANNGFNMPFEIELLRDLDLVDADAAAGAECYY